jgi:hypothetical protein
VSYASPASRGPASGREQYNVIADTVVGPNLRLRDNLIQAASIIVCMLLGVVIGALLLGPNERMAGIIFGGFIGLLVGLFGSGIFLMIYRAVRHLRGRHD